jgi:hypothetical protein
MARRLHLNAERLTDLSPADLTQVVGGEASAVLNCLLSLVLPHCVTDLCLRTTTAR